MGLRELVPEPEAGRVYANTMRPGIADATASGRIRVDAIARWLQDVAYLDLVDAGHDEAGAWILRGARLRVDAFPRFGAELELRTFCSGLGRFSAERRTSVRGSSALVEAVGLWVWLDAETLRPQRFSEEFIETYAESAAGREAKVRLRHPDPPAGAESRRGSFRETDVDVAGHVNNSHYWAPVEEELAGREPAAFDAEIEYRDPGQPGPIEVLSEGSRRWIRADGRILASIVIA